MVSRLLSCRNLLLREAWSSSYRYHQHCCLNHLHLHDWRTHQKIRKLNKYFWCLRHSCIDFLISRRILIRMDPAPLSLSTRSTQLSYSRKWHGSFHVLPQWRGITLRLFLSLCGGKPGVEDVHDERKLGRLRSIIYLVLLG